MKFWWVNHKQTFKEEIEGGYIWSPTKNNDGSRNQTYLNLTAVKVGDIVYSYAAGEIGAVSVVEREYVENERPEAFGHSGEQWDKNPTLKTLFHRFDFAIGIIGVAAIAWWVWRHVKHIRSDSEEGKQV